MNSLSPHKTSTIALILLCTVIAVIFFTIGFYRGLSLTPDRREALKKVAETIEEYRLNALDNARDKLKLEDDIVRLERDLAMCYSSGSGK